jgi:uncharacterized cupredoxin-like copper-binding protein
MRSRHSIPAALCAVAVSLAVVAAPASATTAPGATATIPVTVTNTSIKVAADKFTLKSAPNVARYPRGVTIHFKIKNTGSASVIVTLHLLTKLHVYGASHLKTSVSTKPIAPNATVKLTGTFTFRGNYQLEVRRAGKLVAKNPIVVF